DSPVTRRIACVRQKLGLARSVVHVFRPGIADTELQARRHAAVRADLQRVVLSPARILGKPDNPEPAIRSQSVGIHSRIRLHSSRRQLVYVALPLVVVATASNVGNLESEARSQLPLQRDVPDKG